MMCPLCKKPAHVETLAAGWQFSGACCGYKFLTDTKGRVVDVHDTQRTRVPQSNLIAAVVGKPA